MSLGRRNLFQVKSRTRSIIISIIFSTGFLLSANIATAQPSVLDSSLTVDHLLDVPFKPSNMKFLNQNEILILDRDQGRVYVIKDSEMRQEPLLDVNVATVGYRGLLGIDTLTGKDNVTYIFLYYTESISKDGDDESDPGGFQPVGNRLYRYQLEDGKLINPKLLLDLPVRPGPRHTGGEVAIGPDNNIYLTVGDLDGTFKKDYETMAQNYVNATKLDGRSGILRVTPDGKPISTGILGNKFPLNLYLAYGIRNSFGLDWDPLTGNLWDTENGPHYGDEINLVMPGFNSGWVSVQGFWKPDFEDKGTQVLEPKGLVTFDGRGVYSKPEFAWVLPVAPTALKFFPSTAYGRDYENDLFVADANTGHIYHFELNVNRSKLYLQGSLRDQIAHDTEETNEIIFAQGFGRITDMQLGPDGNLYVLSSKKDGASLNRIIRAN
jgi:aldose sugar dehydrogenase